MKIGETQITENVRFQTMIVKPDGTRRGWLDFNIVAEAEEYMEEHDTVEWELHAVRYIETRERIQ